MHMEDRFAKYSKLYIIIFLMFLSIPVFIGLIVAVFYGFSKLISSSIANFIFGLGIVSIAPALFSTVCYIFFKRTKKHPVAVVRIISKTLFVIGIAVSVYVLASDMISYFTKHSVDIYGYKSYSLLYMAGNVAGLFLIAIMQAFTTKKEVDWMDRNK